jgi:hypothetical protein
VAIKKERCVLKDMSRKEIVSFIKDWTWGTLIAVEGNNPYAVEVSYGTDGKYIYCGTRPGGRMWKCIGDNPNVVFKICDSDRSCNRWHAVLVEGIAQRLTSREDILFSCRCIASQMGLQKESFDRIAGHVALDPRSNSLKIPLTDISGKAIGY